MQICLITGANRGIGLALARKALELNYRVIATHRGRDLEKLQDLANSAGDRMKLMKVDVSQTTDVEQMVQNMPLPHIDILINNAGVLLDEAVPFSELSEKTLMDTFRVNVWGPTLVTQKCLPLLINSANPRVAHVSSSMGSIAENASGRYYAYRSSKAALNMIHKSLSHDFPKLTTIAFHPGWVQTDMGGPSAAITPSQSADGIWRTLQTASHNDTGKFLSFDGREVAW